MTDGTTGEAAGGERRPATTIPGIGRKRARWLAAMFDVHTVADLAGVDADALSRGLESAGDSSGAHAARRWVADARLTLARVDPPAEHPVEDGPDWEPFAAFVVEIQRRPGDDQIELLTSVHHVEADLTVSWRGVLPIEACAWIAARADETAQATGDG